MRGGIAASVKKQGRDHSQQNGETHRGCSCFDSPDGRVCHAPPDSTERRLSTARQLHGVTQTGTWRRPLRCAGGPNIGTQITLGMSDASGAVSSELSPPHMPSSKRSLRLRQAERAAVAHPPPCG